MTWYILCISTYNYYFSISDNQSGSETESIYCFSKVLSHSQWVSAGVVLSKIIFSKIGILRIWEICLTRSYIVIDSPDQILSEVILFFRIISNFNIAEITVSI